MLFKLIQKLDQKIHLPTASAHCDVPCGVYDPISAQIGALTVIRMVDQLNELQELGLDNIANQAKFGRVVAEKERSSAIVKEEVRIIWGDYIKAPQLEKFPQLHELVHNIMMQASKCKQTIDKDAALQLLALVNEFAEIFWATKGIETFTATCPYPPSQQVVYPKLGA